MAADKVGDRYPNANPLSFNCERCKRREWFWRGCFARPVKEVVVDEY